MDAICIWDVRTGKLLRKMPCSDPEWPSYKFSYDEKYFATKGKDSIAVYAALSSALMALAMNSTPTPTLISLNSIAS